MNRGLLTVLLVLLIIISAYIYNNFFTGGIIVGKYVNRNYSNPSTGAEMPNVKDTIILFSNGKFDSQAWGKGTWLIKYGIKGTTIAFSYSDKFGQAVFETYIQRLNYNHLKIITNDDLDQYYEKIN